MNADRNSWWDYDEEAALQAWYQQSYEDAYLAEQMEHQDQPSEHESEGDPDA